MSWFGSLSEQITGKFAELIQAPEEHKDKNVAGDSKPAMEEQQSDSASNEALTGEVVGNNKTDEKSGFAVDKLSKTLFNFANKASVTVSSTAKSLIHAVEENTILGDFESEQKKFAEETNKTSCESSYAAVAPWVGCTDETALKKQILALSLDSRNFLRDPPAGTQFNFDFAATFPVAQAVLDEDTNLRKMRFALVPKEVKEDRFWRNYFYRVSLIKQSSQLQTGMAKLDAVALSGDAAARKHSDMPQVPAPEGQTVDEGGSTLLPQTSEEFVSDTFESTLNESELHKEREQLGIDNTDTHAPASDKHQADSEWEDELVAELKEYELVTEQNGSEKTVKSEEEWEEELDKLMRS